MDGTAIALFGEAEKGEFQRGYLCNQLEELVSLFGNPPAESRGLFYATQAILYHYPLIFFRVKEEGFSKEDYFKGVKILSESELITQVKAICTPGVGDREIMEPLFGLCKTYHQFLITNERDWIDYIYAV